jgi:hypothetical protein
VRLSLGCSGELAAAANDPDLAEMIRSETLAESLTVSAEAAGSSSHSHQADEEVDGDKVRVALDPK